MNNQALSKIVMLFMCILSIAIIWFLAIQQIVPSNYYLGMRDLKLNEYLPLFLFLFFVFSIPFLVTTMDSPEGIFAGLFLFFSIAWLVFLHSVSGIEGFWLPFIASLFTVIPIYIVTFFNRYIKIDYGIDPVVNGVFGLRIEVVMTIFLILVILAVNNTMSLSFSFADSYDRRLEGRDKITGILAYFFAMGMNGVAPLLAFLSFQNKRYHYFFVSITFVILVYGFIGSKAPIASVLLMAFVGSTFSFGKRYFIKQLFYIVFFIILLALLEYYVLGYSYIADIFIRRVVLVAVQIQMYFVDYLTNNDYFSSVLFSNLDINKTITYRIGEEYFSNPLTNANTNTFLTEFGNRGAIGYIFNLLFVMFLFNFLSYLYRRTNNTVWLAVPIIYIILLLEQSYSIAFVTSGIGLCIFLLLLFKSRD